jgi:hypothetical protein
VSLRNEFNEVAPGRDKRSDGWKGDKPHELRVSDHNGDESGKTPYEDDDNVDEVHGLDVDASGPWPAGLDMGHFTREIAKRHRLGLDDRLQNIIHAGQIASRSWGWTWQTYEGDNQHHEHAHFSARYTPAQEASTRPWGLLQLVEEDTDLNTQQINQLAAATANAILTSTVKVGDEQWTVGSCIGYMARKGFETDLNTDGLEALLTRVAVGVEALGAALAPAPKDGPTAAPSKPAGAATKR